MKKVYADISFANTVENWKKFRNQVDGVIIRCGFRGYSKTGVIKTDAKWYQNIDNAIKFGMPFGIYFISQAVNKEEAKEEARYCLELLRERNAMNLITLPIFIDIESSSEPNHKGRADGNSWGIRADIATAFMETIRDEGRLTSGVYASKSWLDNMYKTSWFNDGFCVWVAQYNGSCTFAFHYDAWQYTSKGKCEGVLGYVDLSVGIMAQNRRYDPNGAPPEMKKQNLYWVTIADVWTEEEAVAVAERLKKKYPDLAMGVRCGDLNTIRVIC